jgi:hypothetical protein
MQQDEAKWDANAIAEAANTLTNVLSKALTEGTIESLPKAPLRGNA